MGRKLFVGNIPFSAGEAELQSLFSKAGTVDTVHIPTDRTSGRPRGFAFVEMTTDEAAAAAISQFDQSEMAGRRINVNEARPRAPRGNSGRFELRRDQRW